MRKYLKPFILTTNYLKQKCTHFIRYLIKRDFEYTLLYMNDIYIQQFMYKSRSN